MTLTETLVSLGVATAAGGLIGAERQQAQSDHPDGGDFGGIRTYPLLAIAGVVSGWLALVLGGWVVGALLAAVTVMVAVSQARAEHGGATSEVAAAITFGLGVLSGTPQFLTGSDRFLVVAAVAATTMALLALKRPLHGFAARVSSGDLYATVKFVLLAAVVLPLLPNRVFGPLQVLNPYKIGLMIALVAGVSFAGYVVARVIGSRRGLLVAGLVGGLVSSTAVTLSLSSRARDQPDLARLAGVGIVAACATMALRLLALMGVAGASLLPRLWLPLGAMAVAGYGFAAFSYFRGAKGHAQQEIAFHNPFELRRAVEFGFVYGVVLFVSAAAQRYLGTGGTYASAAFAGLADVDAIALSLAELHGASGTGETAANAIVLAALVNTATKTALCVFIGRGALARHVVPALAAMGIAATAGVFVL